MTILKGVGISNGIAIGKALLILDEDLVVIKEHVSKKKIEKNFSAFKTAVQEAKKEIRNVKKQLKSKIPEEHAFIFDTHIMLLEDTTLHAETLSFMKKQSCNVEWAFNQVLIRLLREFEALEDPYFVERAKDLEDVGKRVLRILLKEKERKLGDLDEDMVVIGHEFGPSNITTFDNPHIKGFATDIGGQTTHTAIIAKALKIPAVLGLHNITRQVTTGDLLILDSLKGEIIVNPDKKTLKLYKKKRDTYRSEELGYLEEIMLPCVSKDGVKINLQANIEILTEANTAMDHGAEGVGLYRTEFLFLKTAPYLPTEEEHFETYCQMARSIGDKVLTVRTLDLGGEKYFHQTLIHKKENNPVLGLRGVRLCLFKKDIFRTQLRGLLKAAQLFPSIRIMFPLITGYNELMEVLAFYKKTKEELQSEDPHFNAEPDIGIMIEVPSAAMIADYLAKEVDFISVGTNDLMQYLLAIDRGNDQVTYLYDPFHPGFMRIITQIVKAAQEANIQVSCCGEMASSPLYACMLIHLGIKTLSMNPASLPNLKHFIRSIDLSKLRESVPSIVNKPNAKELRQRYLDAMKKNLDKIDYDHFFGERC
ncbi:MAG: phosphoenolpyruvate--protein phosphotransferase [Acidobacteria bacterium]|nr:MAG: phosphoenolpyruvate--protein phosphotransferase [Acidobacteriota bacterium]